MVITNKVHLQLLKEINQLTPYSSNYKWPKNYLGTNKIYHGFNTNQIISLANKIVKDNELTDLQILDLSDSLYKNGKSYTEIAIASMILSQSKTLLKNFDPNYLNTWLNYTCGWAENDVLCQSNFDSEILLSNWPNWQKILKQFNHDKNINKRRASLVLLTKSLRNSNDPRLSKISFENIENLKTEKDILIIKAVSWLLRSLVKFHQKEVLNYLEKNKNILPGFVYREVYSKATTGRKYNKKLKTDI